MKKLSETQITILTNAADRTDGNIEPLPGKINAGIKPRVISGLLNRGLIYEYKGYYKISAIGLTAINKEVPQEKEKPIETDIKSKKLPREGSKLATVVALLNNEGGATLEELCAATGWQKHTLRGTFASSLKKRFELTITSTKKEGEPRRYAIIDNVGK